MKPARSTCHNTWWLSWFLPVASSNHLLCSALEIEHVLLDHPAVKECAVIGVPDDMYGERVGAIVVPKITKQVNGMFLLLGIGCGPTTVTKLCCGTQQRVTSNCQQTKGGRGCACSCQQTRGGRGCVCSCDTHICMCPRLEVCCGTVC